ncbi:MAG: anion permease [Brevundimonas sp.]|uniref:SLC13 family permease n=1 Tax=Brevundimonas albigilva TaxID=1312364 RepID=A0ABY4SHN5_9CAUL|nr:MULTISPECIES: SLC13 family permease [Brevundimonas]MCV0413768.1 anion permease [Brevundimonas sp.]UQV17577.1 SLC13 family permease [Brevundimonas albigilva]URI14510.1 SLC13 family permease [Brevundimonas albigilva]
MTLQQGLAFGLVGLTVAAFIWGRFRYDLVAVGALVAGLAIGVIPAEDAFEGFANDVTVIIACALVVSAAFAKSGIVEMALKRVMPYLKTERSQVPVLTTAVTLLSMVTKNVGALAIMMPVALQVARRTGTPQSRLLMPMAFGAMAGGMVTLVGTSPNILVAEVRQDIVGQPFQMFDYAPVGLALTAAALAFLAFGYRLLPKDRTGALGLSAALSANAYLTEAHAPEDWPLEPTTITALSEAAGGEVKVMALIREGKRKARPRGNTVVRPGDTLLLKGGQEALEDFIDAARMKLVRGDRPVLLEEAKDEVHLVEAVIGADSPLTGQSVRQLDLYGQHGLNLLGVSRSGYELTQHLRTAKLQSGDVLLLQGSESNLPARLAELRLLPLAEREVRLGGARRKFLPAVVLAVAMVMVGFGVIPVSIAFFGAAVVIVALGGLKMREAYAALDGPLLVLIAALIPVSDAIQQTGGADLIASALRGLFEGIPPVVAVAGMMLASMAVTPFLNNAATVLVVAPIAATLAQQLGYRPDPFLMAVAVGAACDFLTPIGHQCNTMVMGPGGYKFSDYPKLGLPLSLLVLLIGPPTILLFWPM